MDKFQNKYRINSTRLQKWDYGWPASYFITICTHRRINYFGKIKSGILNLSESGCIAQKCWLEIPEHFPCVELSDFVVMPNHVHGILTITTIKSDDDHHSVETRHALSLPISPPNPNTPPNPITPPDPSPTPGQKRFQHQGSNTVSSIIGGYKSAVTRNTRLTGIEFRWQDRFWDHVIHDNNEFERIRKYIIDNPANWQDDDFYR